MENKIPLLKRKTEMKAVKKNILREGTVVVDLVFHLPVLNRVDRSKKVMTEGDQKWFSVLKAIVKSPAYSKLLDLISRTRKKMEMRSIPDPIMIVKKGSYLVPTTVIEDVSEDLEFVVTQFNKAADAFAAEYGVCIQNAKEALKDAFDEKNYPTVAYMRKRCWVDVRLLDIDVPSAEKVGEYIATAAQEAALAAWNEAAVEVTYALREEAVKLIGHFAEQLGTTEDGKKKKLTDPAMEKTCAWLELFSKRNVMCDDELKALALEAQTLIKGKSAEAIRSDDSLRKELKGKFDTVKENLDKLMVDRPARRIVFDDDNN